MTSVAQANERGGAIYGLVRTTDEARAVRYVGKTIQDPRRRMAAHEHNARRGAQTPVAKWMRKHEGDVEMIMLAAAEDYLALCALERALIAELHTLTTQGGLNCTEGGDGSVGWVNGPEAIEKIRAKATGRKRSPESIAKAIASRAGWKPSTETLELWSAQRKGRTFTPEALKNMRGSARRGEASNRATTTREQAYQVKNMVWDARPYKEISKRVGVSLSVVSAISSERAWKHLPWPGDRPRTPYVRRGGPSAAPT